MFYYQIINWTAKLIKFLANINFNQKKSCKIQDWKISPKFILYTVGFWFKIFSYLHFCSTLISDAFIATKIVKILEWLNFNVKRGAVEASLLNYDQLEHGKCLNIVGKRFLYHQHRIKKQWSIKEATMITKFVSKLCLGKHYEHYEHLDFSCILCFVRSILYFFDSYKDNCSYTKVCIH